MRGRFMKKLIVVVFILILIIAGVFLVKKRKKELEKASVYNPEPAIVSVCKTKMGSIEKTQIYLATVEPILISKISSKINAFIEKEYVSEGSIVKKGDILAELDNAEILAKIEKAKGEFSAAQQNLNYWQKEYKRNKNLYEKGAISKDELDKTINALAQAKGKYISSKKNVEYWQSLLKYVVIKSPYDGVITRKYLDVGNLATVNNPVFELQSLHKKLVFKMPQADVKFTKNLKKIAYLFQNKWKYTKIIKTYPSLDNDKMLTVEAYLNNDFLKSGMFVKVKIVLSKKENTIILPVSAICNLNKNPYVYIVKDNLLHSYPVKLGIVSNGWVEVLNMKKDVLVVKSPFMVGVTLSDNQKVKILREKE